MVKTIILYGIGKVVLRMTFGKQSEDKIDVVNKNKPKILNCMYLPQIIMLIIVFVVKKD